nr:hypothetical protein [Ganoderma lingzhi]
MFQFNYSLFKNLKKNNQFMKYFTKIKEIFNKILLFYYRIVKIHTGYRIPNKFFLLSIITISVASIFLRNNFLDYYKDNFIILSVIFFLGILNMIYIQFNLLCRITVTLYKGIPYFKHSIRWCVRYGYIGLSYFKKLIKRIELLFYRHEW